MTTHTIGNIVYKITESSARALYTLHKSCFDAIMNDIEPIDICLESSYSYYYDMYMGHNCFEYAQKAINWCSAAHLPSIIFFHVYPPQKLKKEDFFLLKNSLSKSTKIFLGEDIANHWNHDTWEKSHVINYGVPISSTVPPDKNKSKDILVINSSNNNQIANLYNLLSKKYPNSNIVSSLTFDQNRNTEILSDYKIVIDIDNTINILCAISSGAKVIGSSICTISEDFRHYYRMLNYNNIGVVIDNIIHDAITAEDIEHNKSILQSKYNHDNFSQQITSIIKDVKKEMFVL